MSRRTLIIARNDLALLWKDPTPAVILIVIPLVLIPFLKPVWSLVLKFEGYIHANGAEQAVPGVAILFAFYLMVFGSLPFFREYVWNTWDRIRSAPITNTELLVGKIVPTMMMLLCQQAVLFGLGIIAFKLHVNHALPEMVVVDLAFSLWVMSFLLLAVAFSRTFQQVVSVANLSAILLAALGGVLTPLKTLPGWGQAIAPITPTYWAMKGFNDVILEGEGFSSIALPVGVLCGATVVFVTLAAIRFNLAETKHGTLET
jgi:ABC-2 type transport system permease protein